MKRININTQGTHFIGCWNLENNKLCNEITNFFKKNKNLHKQGVTASGKDLKKKSRIDITVSPNDLKKPKFEILKQYVNELYKCFLDYQNQWPFLKSMIKDIDIGEFNIGEYSPGDHFAKLHSERTSLATLHRVFAWMTYLNDVEDGGGTSFPTQELEFDARCGDMVIWPAYWTHPHHGIVSPTQTKYIASGWFIFKKKDNYNNIGNKLTTK